MKKNSNLNSYGSPPFKIAVIHGGPGAQGYMKPVALELSQKCGILEPLQTKHTLEEQINELKEQILEYTNEPITLLGSSWGAILALFFTSQYQNMVRDLILVGCGVFTKEALNIADNIRMSRLTQEQKIRLDEVLKLLDSSQENKELVKEMSRMLDITDKYNPIMNNGELENLDWNVFTNVWNDFTKIIENTDYIKFIFSKITISVTLIQGDYDAHLAKEVYEFLKESISQTKLYELKKCGHYPWIEKYAKDEFYKIILNSL